MTSSFYHQDRYGTTVPQLYDTSTSTADDSHSSGPRITSAHSRLNSPLGSYDPPAKQRQKQQQQRYDNNDRETSFLSRELPLLPSQGNRYPQTTAVRKAASDTGVPSSFSGGGFDRYRQEFMPSQRPAITSTATTASSSRTLNRSQPPSNTAALSFIDEFNDNEQISLHNRQSNRPQHHQQQEEPSTRLGSLEQTFTFKDYTRTGIGYSKHSGSTYSSVGRYIEDSPKSRTTDRYESVKSRYVDMGGQSRKESRRKYDGTTTTTTVNTRNDSNDREESFEGKIETPPRTSVLDLKRQLWPDGETMRLGGSSDGGPTTTGFGSPHHYHSRWNRSRPQRTSHSLSPSRGGAAGVGDDLNTTFGSDPGGFGGVGGGMTNFKSKYYQAALMAAREREDQEARQSLQHQVRYGGSPSQESSHHRTIIERPRVNSGGTGTSSVPFDEREGRPRSQSVPRSRQYPSSLTIPSLQSSNRLQDRLTSESQQQQVLRDYHHPSNEEGTAMTDTPQQHELANPLLQPAPSIQRRVEGLFSKNIQERPSQPRSHHTRTFSPEPRSNKASKHPFEDPSTTTSQKFGSPSSIHQQQMVDRAERPPLSPPRQRPHSSHARTFSPEPRSSRGLQQQQQQPPFEDPSNVRTVASPSTHQRRVDESSRDIQLQSPPRQRPHSYHVRSFSPEQTATKMELDRSNGENSQLSVKAVIQSSKDRVPTNQTIFKDPILRYTTIKDTPRRAIGTERRPGTPPMDASATKPQDFSPDRVQVDSSRHNHAAIASFWQQKTTPPRRLPVSPKISTPESNVASTSTHTRSSDHQRRSVLESPEGGYKTSESGSSMVDQMLVAGLLAKLTAVDRANPAKALAQIDSILKQETQNHSVGINGDFASPTPEHQQHQLESSSSTTRAISNQYQDWQTENGSADDFDDDTTVSSITNPTFQVSSVGNPEANGGRSQSPFKVSVSAFREPRPSSLQNYSQTVESQGGTGIRRPLEPTAQQEMPAPATKDSQRLSSGKGKLNDLQLPSLGGNLHESRHVDQPQDWTPHEYFPYGDHSRSPADSRKFAENQESNKEGQIQETSTRNQAVPTSDTPQHNEVATSGPTSPRPGISSKGMKMDPEGHDARVILDRGRESAGHNQSHHASRKLPTLTKWQKPHPWETEIPVSAQKLVMSDTSMDDAAGTELHLPRRFAIDELRQSSPTAPRAKVKTKTSHLTMHPKIPIHERALLEALPDDPAVLFHPGLHSPEVRKNVEALHDEQRHDFGRPLFHNAIDASPFENHTSETTTRQISTPLHEDSSKAKGEQDSFKFPEMEFGGHETSSKHSSSPFNPFDTSWPTSSKSSKKDRGSSIPQTPEGSRSSHTPSSQSSEHGTPSFHRPFIASPRNDTEHRRGSRHRGSLMDLDVSNDTSMSELTGMALLGLNLPSSSNDVQRDPKQPEEVERGAVEVTLVSDSDDANTSREKMTHTGRWSGGGGNKVGGGSPNRRFLRGFQKRKEMTTRKKTQESLKPTLQRTVPTVKNSSRLIPSSTTSPTAPPLPPPRGDVSPAVSDKRGRMGLSPSGGPRDRSRSNSKERFRSSNMAKKFGRVMRLYDDHD